MASSAHDDGFHEIQLSGKQLVFLFMAATVVSVVIFLCGVLVGRGVRAERATAVAEGMPTEPPLPPAQPAPPQQAGSDPTDAAPPTPAPEKEKLTYSDRLEHQNRPKEDLKPPAPRPVAPKDSERPAPKPEPAKPAPAPPPAPQPVQAEPAPSADGVFTVQIAALNARAEADQIAKRLSSKGYAAYVVPPGNGAAMYRVRVGRFKTRRDAEPVAARLQREEQYKPWITR